MPRASSRDGSTSKWLSVGDTPVPFVIDDAMNTFAIVPLLHVDCSAKIRNNAVLAAA